MFSNYLSKIQQILPLRVKDKNVKKSNFYLVRSKLWLAIIFGITLFLILISLISLQDLERVFSNINLGYFLAAFALGSSATVIKSFRFNLLFPALGRRIMLYGVFASLRFIYYLLPFNAGELVYLNVLKKYKFIKTITDALPSWLYLRLSDVIALTFWFTVALIFGHLRGGLYEMEYGLRWLFIGISIILIISILFMPYLITKISFSKSGNWLSKKLLLLKDGFIRTAGLSNFLKTIVVSIIIWSILIGWHVLAQSAFNVPLELWQKIFVSITIYLLSLVPINTPLNIGTDDAAWTGALILSGLDLNHSVLIAIGMRVISMFIMFSDGLIGLTILTHKKSDTSRV